jgi:hypothetical protein
MVRSTSLLAAGTALPWAGPALARGHLGDVAFDDDGTALGAWRYAPFPDQSCPNRTDDGDAGQARSIAQSAADWR